MFHLFLPYWSVKHKYEHSYQRRRNAVRCNRLLGQYSILSTYGGTVGMSLAYDLQARQEVPAGRSKLRRRLPMQGTRLALSVLSTSDKIPLPFSFSFLSPLRGWLSFYFFTRGFTPGYILSALRACCGAKRLFALHEKVAEGLI